MTRRRAVSTSTFIIGIVVAAVVVGAGLAAYFAFTPARVTTVVQTAVTTVTEKPTITQPPAPQPLTKVTFILNFGAIGGPQIPYFVALDKGFFREQGLDVEILLGRNTGFAITQVAAGTANLGQAAADGLIASRINADTAVKIVYQVYQDNPTAFFTLKALNITKPSDLSGKKIRIGANIGGSSDIMWELLRVKEGLDASRFEKIPIGFDIVAPLATNAADSVVTFDEAVVDTDAAGIKTNAFFLKDYGLNFPVLAIITTDKFIQEKPDLVRKFVAGANKGIKYSIEHPGEAVDIATKYTAYNVDKNTVRLYGLLQWAIKNMKGSKPDQTLGKIDAQALSDLQDALLKFEKIKKKLDIKEFFTVEFLP